jgi:hypothetical protein
MKYDQHCKKKYVRLVYSAVFIFLYQNFIIIDAVHMTVYILHLMPHKKR